jgi:hypothetical protein
VVFIEPGAEDGQALAANTASSGDNKLQVRVWGERKSGAVVGHTGRGKEVPAFKSPPMRPRDS